MEGEDFFLSRPPTNVKVKRFVKIDKDTTPEMFLKFIKRTFYHATGKTGILSLDQWMKSDLREYIGQGSLTEEEFLEYFEKIDAHKKGSITWNDFAQYLICETGPEEKQVTLKEEAIHVVHSSNAVKKNAHRELITQITNLPWLKIMITLSKDSVKIWKLAPLQYVDSIPNKYGDFSAFCGFQNSQILAIGLSSRRIIFYHAEFMQELPVSIGASPAAKTIKKMDMKETKAVLATLKKQDLPLYNPATQMMEARITPSKPFTLQFIVGDDSGNLSFFTLKTPERRYGDNYTIKQMCTVQAHQGKITEMQCLESISAYASASLDCTLHFFIVDNNSIQIVRTFNELFPILSFTYFDKQHFIAMCLKGSSPSIWVTQPPSKSTTISAQYEQSIKCTSFQQNHGQEFFVTVAKNGDIRLFNNQSFFLHSEYSDSSEIGVYETKEIGSITVDQETSSLILASHYPIIWESIQPKTVCVGITHRSRINNLFYSNDFHRLLSMDEKGTINVYQYERGILESSKRINVKKIKVSTMDTSGRRIFTCSHLKGEIDIWNYNSGGYLDSIKREEDSLIRHMLFIQAKSRQFLAYTTNENKIHLICEIEPDVFLPTIVIDCSQAKDISCIAYDQSTESMVTGTLNGEICMWPLDPNSIPKKITINGNPEIDKIITTPSNGVVFCFSADQMLSVLSMPLLRLEMRLHTLTFEVTYMNSCFDCDNEILVTGDTNGYVQTWKIMKSSVISISSLKLVRCHESEVTFLKIIPNTSLLVTAGYDMMIHLWNMENMECIGTFTYVSSWNIEDETTWTHLTIPPLDKYEEHIKSALSSSRFSSSTQSTIFSQISSRMMPSTRLLRTLTRNLNTSSLASFISNMTSQRSLSSLTNTTQLAQEAGIIQPEENDNQLKSSKSDETFDWVEAYNTFTNFFDSDYHEYHAESLDLCKKYPVKKPKSDLLVDYVLSNDPSAQIQKVLEQTQKHVVVKNSEKPKTKGRVESKLEMIVKPTLKHSGTSPSFQGV